MISDGLKKLLVESFETELEFKVMDIGSLVESPIELDFLMAFLMTQPDVHLVTDDSHMPQNGVTISPQYKFFNYRVDFVICSVKDGEISRTLVVECDGHEFHERTKAQAERDRSRDRFLMSKGLSVFRFTGREIHRNAVQCASEAYDQLWNKKGRAA